MLKMISRTYAQAVAGEIIETFFNTTTAEFLLSYTLNASCTLPTEIYLNEALHYPNGYDVVVYPPVLVKWTSPATNSITVVASADVADGTTILVNISPK